jgi:hypothetical protein
MSTTMMAKLRAAILTGTVALLPTVALADEATPSGEPTPTPGSYDATDRVPDHAQAEARGGSSDAAAVTVPGVPDHAEAQARGAGELFTGDQTQTHVPDHAQAEDPHADK